jgi:hypothetical protein
MGDGVGCVRFVPLIQCLAALEGDLNGNSFNINREILLSFPEQAGASSLSPALAHFSRTPDDPVQSRRVRTSTIDS